MAVSGVVLAGGHSRRFGRDKRTVRVGGVPVLRRAVETVAAVADEVLVVTRPDRALPADLTLPVGTRVLHDVPLDDLLPDAGPRSDATPGTPLAGLLAGLRAARHDVVVVLGGDHPWASPSTLSAAAEHLAADPTLDACVADDGRAQPLVGAYRKRVAEPAAARLAAGDPRLVGLLDHLTVRRDPSLPALATSVRDIDAPTDLEAVDAAPPRAIGHVEVVRVRAGVASPAAHDQVVVEEPLSIAVAGPDGAAHEVTTTLRTPGHEAELAVGFLHAEGLLRSGDVAAITAGDVRTEARPDDRVTVHLTRPVDSSRLTHRHVGATASCGWCGRATIDDLLTRVAPLPPGPVVPWSVLASLPDRLREAQATFAATGGLHATGIADLEGRLLTVREDVGRHNALDAAIGRHVLDGEVPLADRIVVLSGRVGTELVQKLAVAGSPIVVAVGAPSDLAVRTARELRLTLVGFVRDGGGNVYTHPDRIQTDDRADDDRADVRGDDGPAHLPDPRRRSLT